MTYEQSWQNIRKLLALIRPVDGSTLYFKFTGETAFELSYEEIDFAEQDDKNLPFATMYYNKNGEDVLTYDDTNAHWSFSMTTGRIVKFGIKTKFSLEAVQKQFQELSRMTKKS